MARKGISVVPKAKKSNKKQFPKQENSHGGREGYCSFDCPFIIKISAFNYMCGYDEKDKDLDYYDGFLATEECCLVVKNKERLRKIKLLDKNEE